MSLPSCIYRGRSKGFLPKFWSECVASFWFSQLIKSLAYASIGNGLPSCNVLLVKNLDRSLLLLLPSKNFGNPLRGSLRRRYLPRRNGFSGVRPSKFRRDWLGSWRTCLHFCHQFECWVRINGERAVARRVRMAGRWGCEWETPLYWWDVTK